MTMVRTMTGCLLLGLVGSVLLGCGGRPERPSAAIEGVVRLDGQPLEKGSIHFTSPKTGETAYANLGEGGTYRVEFPEADLGEQYQVSLQQPIAEVEFATDAPTNQPQQVKLPRKFTERTTSGLTVEIQEEGTMTHDFDLSSS